MLVLFISIIIYLYNTTVKRFLPLVAHFEHNEHMHQHANTLLVSVSLQKHQRDLKERNINVSYCFKVCELGTLSYSISDIAHTLFC